MRKIEPVLLLITSLVVFFTILLLITAKFLSSDGQTFQVLSSALSGCLGALLMRVKPAGKVEGDAQQISQVTVMNEGKV